MKKVIGMGNALVDLLVSIPDDTILNEFGVSKGGMYLVNLSEINKIIEIIKKFSVSTMCGGSAANTIHGLSMLGIDCSFVGKVSNDKFGDSFRHDLINCAVEPILFKGEPQTGIAVALISPDSERTFITYLGAAVNLSDKEIIPEIFNGGSYFHIEGYLVQNHDLIEKALATAKGLGLTTSIDLASYNIVSENIEFLKKLIKNFVDIVFANEDEALSFTGLSPEESVIKISEMCRIAVVKTGKTGSLISCGRNVCHIEPFDAEIIDTTGAGDLYASGFLYGMINEMPLKKCASIGSFLASKVIERIGAKIPADKWDDIKNKIETI